MIISDYDTEMQIEMSYLKLINVNNKTNRCLEVPLDSIIESPANQYGFEIQANRFIIKNNTMQYAYIVRGVW